MLPPLVPCAATATSFLYADQNSVVCCCRETLAFERLFGLHSDIVTLLVSNPTRDLVVSCDSEAAFVWNPKSGEEKNRLSLPERMTAAAWMKNGIVVLGSCLGKIFLFNPDTGCSDFKLTLDNEITAIAPAFVLGSWIFAVGYRNGSFLLYKVDSSIEVVFNIPHIPSPIAGLSWHASHPLLAMHDANGNLSTWRIDSISQITERRITERQRDQSSHCWIGWSKQGRLIYYRDRQGHCWDVRGSVAKSNPIPVPDSVTGISIYGPGAKLFTLVEGRTVQLFDLTNGCLLTTRQHPHILPAARSLVICDTVPGLSSPRRSSIASIASGVPSRASTEITVMFSTSPSGCDSDDDGGSYVTDLASAIGSSVCEEWPSSPFSNDTNGQLVTTLDSESSILGQHLYGVPKEDSFPPLTFDSSPSAVTVDDLFPRTRSRMLRSRLPRGRTQVVGARVDYGKEILAIVFDWPGTAEELLKSEMSHATSSAVRHALLATWLSGLDTFEGIAWDDVNTKQQLAHRRQQVDDIHSAVSLLISAHLHGQAIDMYVAAGRYMEAMIACLLFLPSWDCQSGLLSKWALAEQQTAPELSRRCLCFLENQKTTAPRSQEGTRPVVYCSPQRDLAKIAPLQLATSFEVSTTSQSPNIRSAFPVGRSTEVRHPNVPLSAGPKTAIERIERVEWPPEQGRKLNKMVSKWKSKVRRESDDRTPVTAYKDDSNVIGNMI